MRIRTRYKLFRAIIALALLVFVFSLVDMFALDSEWQVAVLLVYAVLLVAALLLYIGYKPTLEPDEPILTEELPAGAPPPMEEPVAVEVEEVPKARRAVGRLDVQGPHHFRCPYCSNLFSLEATHAARSADFRMDCPYCANNIRVPHRPKVASGRLEALRGAAPSDRVLYACANCGEVLRFTAPRSRLERALRVASCPNCRGAQVVHATAA